MTACLEIPLCDLSLSALHAGPNSINTKLSTPHTPPGLVKRSLSGSGVGPTSHKWVKRPNEFHWFRINVCQHWSVHEMDGRWPFELPISPDARTEYRAAVTVINEDLGLEIRDCRILFLETDRSLS